MLQIVTGIYFDEGAPTHDTVHRRILYTNGRLWLRPPFRLPVGELAPSTSVAPVTSLTLTVTESLQKQSADEPLPGELISTSGDELVDDIADVLSFAWNLTVSTSSDLVARLVPATLNTHSFRTLTGTFSRTFDPEVVLDDQAVNDANRFITKLIALHRQHYEAVMRAIRRLLAATRSALEDPTMAYTDMVAALESLSTDCTCHPERANADSPTPTWDQINGRNRRILDEALANLEPVDVERVRQAILEAEQTGSRKRFVDFVLTHLSADYYGTEAAAAIRPVRRPDTERLLRRAYDIRSQHVHSLRQLPREASGITGRAETVVPPDESPMLTLEGLARIARHVICAYIDRAPTDVDQTFIWLDNVPGRFRMRLAPQYWLHDANDLSPAEASRYFEGLVESVIELHSGRADGIVDMGTVLAKIEEEARGLAPGDTRTTYAAIYTLWHRIMSDSAHRPNARATLRRHQDDLTDPTIQAFTIHLLTGADPGWTTEQWQDLATHRLADRRAGTGILLPPAVDASLHTWLVDKLLQEGRRTDAAASALDALGELPGDEQLTALAAAIPRAEYFNVDLVRLRQGTADDSPLEVVAVPWPTPDETGHDD
ncbi:hypothetical protein [Nocardioides sp. URHA0020]|uniref:hypothetical protein n=1 Tax=Nocardioides sp. URHA0020 TaxID=1380392 RepID=UPI00048F758F|nr:hypothetical protein [Nocardioides sp. URHA0020]